MPGPGPETATCCLTEPERALEILHVEDNPGDVRLTREVLRHARVPNRLSAVPDGVEAVAFLRREGKYAHAPRPDLILLDLNLPRMDGRELLAEVKGDPALRRIPVIVLTTSDAGQDVEMCYDRHANCYIRKPVEFRDFSAVVEAIERFWLSVARLDAGEG